MNGNTLLALIEAGLTPADALSALAAADGAGQALPDINEISDQAEALEAELEACRAGWLDVCIKRRDLYPYGLLLHAKTTGERSG